MEALLALLSPLAEFGFMRRALAGCVALSLGCAPVGVFLLLRRMSLTGDAMAHAVLPGAAIGYLLAGLSLPAMTAGGVAAGLLVAAASGLAARATALHATLALLVGVALLTMATLALLYRPLVLECLDAQFLRSAGGSAASALAHYGLLGLMVCNLVAGFHALGTLMAVGIMVLPAATARLWVRRVSALMALATLLALAGCLAGLLASWHLDWPASPAIVLALGAAYTFSLLAGRDGLLRPRLRAARHLQR